MKKTIETENRLPHTRIYELEEEVRRLNRRTRILEADNERLKTQAATMCRKTFWLLRALGMSEKEILAWYREENV